MKLNKFKTIAPAAALLLSASLSSCMADLDKGNIDPNVETNPNTLGLYTKCYAGLIMEGNDGNADFTIDDAGKSTLLRNIFNFNELPTDEAICWWSDGGLVDISYNKYNAATPTLKYLYYRLMSNISFENNYLNIDAAKEDKARYAEVRVIRAYNYFLMLDFFGDPAFVEKSSSESPYQAHTYNSKFEANKTYTRAELLQMGREFLFKWVEKELLEAEPDLLPAKPEKDNDPDYGRVDKGTCWLLLSRLYLNAGTYLNNDGQDNPYWDKALQYAENVINSEYALFDDSKISEAAKANGYKPYDLLFMGDNGSNGASCEALLRDFERRRKEKTAAAFKDGMQIISTELSAGYSLENAFRESLGEIEMLYGQDSEIYKSFAEIAARININTNIEDAFADFAGKANVEEIDSFAQVLTYAKRNGGNLVDIIRNTTDTISDKIEVKREISAITSAKKLEQNIMNLVPIGIILYMRLTSAEMFNKLYGNAVGILIMTICLVIYFAARMLASHIADIKV